MAQSSPSLQTVPAWLVNHLNHRDLNLDPIAHFFQHFAHEATPKGKANLVEADQVADEVGLDDELVEGLMGGMGLE